MAYCHAFERKCCKPYNTATPIKCEYVEQKMKRKQKNPHPMLYRKCNVKGFAWNFEINIPENKFPAMFATPIIGTIYPVSSIDISWSSAIMLFKKSMGIKYATISNP